MLTYEEIRESFQEYKEKILELIEKKIYSFERYGIEFSTLLIYSDSPIDKKICNTYIRQSDTVYMLEENFVLVVYDVIDPENSIKAAQNFLHKYQNYKLKQTMYLAVATAEQEETAIDMASRLFIILEYAIRENLANSVIDINQMRY